ncbi:MAG: hypothetical protein DWQ36_01865 [Acidobacteria bacterium]|nr:MAG: hypothetical protein DWQ30_16710 [Acidobacteriota bacterium]REK11516.1 MAG: hypothetical protein DWQ36_01865 [Acidobacteriota bacterium]
MFPGARLRSRIDSGDRPRHFDRRRALAWALGLLFARGTSGRAASSPSAFPPLREDLPPSPRRAGPEAPAVAQPADASGVDVPARALLPPALGISTRAVDLVRDTTVIDLLGLLTLDWHRLFGWQREPAGFGVERYRELEASGVGVLHPAVETGEADARRGVLRWLRGWRNLVGDGSCFLAPVGSAEALVRASSSGRIGVVVGFQNGTHFDGGADVDLFFRLGQRVSQLTYDGRNRLGSGCRVRSDEGLTALGHEIVHAMGDVGMALDVSHAGERTALQAIAASSRPVLLTHTNCRALHEHPRNASDELLRAVAEKGGVVGLTIVSAFVGPSRRADLERLIDHYEHALDIAGTEHVAIGSDADAEARVAGSDRPNPFYVLRGMEPRWRVFQIADALLRRGWSEEVVRGVLGGNAQRVLSSIWPPERGWQRSGRDPFCPAPARPLLWR